MSDDMLSTIEPRSDQLNADDALAGDLTVTITGRKITASEQPVSLELAEYPGRPYKPNKSMRRILVQGWGPDSSKYVGQRLILRRDPDVKWAGEAVGGLRIVAMSGLDGPLRTALTVSRNKREEWIVQPLPTTPQAPVGATDEQIEAADVDGLRALWNHATPTQQDRIRERVQELQEEGDVA